MGPLLTKLSAVVLAAFLLSKGGQSGRSVPEPVQEPATVRTVVKMVIDAYGGENALKRVSRVYAEGANEAYMRRGKGSYVRYFDREDRRLRVEVSYEGSSETRILNGHRGWRGVDGEEPVEVNGQKYQAMVYQFKQIDLPYGILTRAFRIVDLGMDKLGGRPVRVFGLDDNEGPSMVAYIDAESGLILKTSGLFRANGAVSELSAEFSDFRKVSGVMMPHRIKNFASGIEIGATEIKKYDTGRDMDWRMFKP